MANHCLIADRRPALVDAQLVQPVDFVKQLAHLMRGIAQRNRPQPLLEPRAVAFRPREQGTPRVRRGLTIGLHQRFSQRRLTGLHSLTDQPLQRSVMRDQDAMLVQPAFQFMQQVTAARLACQPLLEPARHVTPLMLGHRTEPEGLVGQHLVVHQGIGAPVIQRTQRAHIRRSDVKLRADKDPEEFRHLLVGIEGAARYADKADVNGAGQAVQVAAPRVNHGPLLGGEREERGELELAEFARNLPHAEIRQLPVIHRAYSQA
ncbi:hypothetical protein D9M72_377330 [compost metagenome]